MDEPTQSLSESIKKVDDLIKEDIEIIGQADNRTILFLKEVLIKATEIKIWRDEQFKQVELAAEDVHAYSELLASVTENQMFSLLNIAKSLGDEIYKLFKSLIDHRKLEQEVSDVFKETFSELFPKWSTDNTSEESSEIMTKYLADLKEQQEWKIREELSTNPTSSLTKQEFVDAHREARKGIILKSADNSASLDGLTELAYFIKSSKLEKKEVLDNEVKSDFRQRLQAAIAKGIKDLLWAAKLTEKAFFDIDDKQELTDLIAMKLMLTDVLTIGNAIDQAITERIKLDFDPEESEEKPKLLLSKKVGNEFFSDVDLQNLYNAWANQATKSNTEDLVEKKDAFIDEKDELEKAIQEKNLKICNKLDASNEDNIHNSDGTLSRPERPPRTDISTNSQQEEQRAKLREQLDKVKHMTTAELFQFIANVSKGNAVDSEEFKLVVAELKNRSLKTVLP